MTPTLIHGLILFHVLIQCNVELRQDTNEQLRTRLWQLGSAGIGTHDLQNKSLTVYPRLLYPHYYLLLPNRLLQPQHWLLHLIIDCYNFINDSFTLDPYSYSLNSVSYTLTLTPLFGEAVMQYEAMLFFIFYPILPSLLPAWCALLSLIYLEREQEMERNRKKRRKNEPHTVTNSPCSVLSSCSCWLFTGWVTSNYTATLFLLHTHRHRHKWFGQSVGVGYVQCCKPCNLSFLFRACLKS